MISPQRDMVTSAIKTINIIVDNIPIFDSRESDSNSYPQIIVSTGSTEDSQRAKNEQRSSYTLYVDYFDDVDNDHGLMMDTCYMIRNYLMYLRLSNYNCKSVAHNEIEVIDNSTSQSLRHVTITIDYNITEKSFI
ncbi:hypothetical protein [Companilactobacillus bobalius]|uniref:DUF3168 domain-containing protein n=1 Tax=Companilactobacillus bobalius TaxID=2801451 RepID=A0A202F3A0_9LACO|nr:hypothetical protein [Companilactobacillus bobalius]KAE9560120.1 hypothetical protein ATN92_07795 [Companilactobacillus bobalius]OVE94945.1 hypothetical protein LKACC16343_02796 [Companilactobacillus bobalius]GEO58702.1 hypothetical protein LBO01_18310 [Companilactobacillus paralimentarius]